MVFVHLELKYLWQLAKSPVTSLVSMRNCCIWRNRGGVGIISVTEMINKQRSVQWIYVRNRSKVVSHARLKLLPVTSTRKTIYFLLSIAPVSNWNLASHKSELLSSHLANLSLKPSRLSNSHARCENSFALSRICLLWVLLIAVDTKKNKQMKIEYHEIPRAFGIGHSPSSFISFAHFDCASVDCNERSSLFNLSNSFCFSAISDVNLATRLLFSAILSSNWLGVSVILSSTSRK